MLQYGYIMTKLKNILSNIITYIQVTILSLLAVIVGVIIALPLWIWSIFSDKKDKKQALEFYTENKDEYYFFYNNKKGWGDFIKNNIIPALPKNTKVYNVFTNIKENPLFLIKIIFKMYNTPIHNIRLPFLIKLEDSNPKIFSFWDDYNTYKKDSAHNPVLQDEIKSKIDKF